MSSSNTDLSMPMLNCGLCKSMFKEPRILPCVHSFCHPCLLQLPLHSDSQGQTTLQCPQCQHQSVLPPEGVSGLTENHFLVRMCHDYVGEVQKTLGSSRPYYTGSGGPASPVSIVSGRPPAATQYPASQTGSSSPQQGVPSPTSPTQATAFSYGLRRSSAPYVPSTSESIYHSMRRMSSEAISGRSNRRKISTTPPNVLKVWEGLQRKLNSLQSSSLQLTYSLENVNMAESNWHQRKQDLRRDVQRRSAQLQFFIKRQERLLLAVLDSKDSDDSFNNAADRARNDLRANLRSVVHETDVLKSILDLANDPELLTLGRMLLGSPVSQHPVTLEIPELKFKVPEEGSLEDVMGKDFGCFTTKTVAQDLYTPEIIEIDMPQEEFLQEQPPQEELPQEELLQEELLQEELLQEEQPAVELSQGEPVEQQGRPENEDDDDYETFVTETFVLDMPPAGQLASIPAQDNIQNVTEEEPEVEPEQEEEQEEEEEEEEETDEEEMIVEETFEIIDGKMQAISTVRRPAPKAEGSQSKSADKSAKKTEKPKEIKPAEPKSPGHRGRGTDVRRTANSCPVSLSRTGQTVPSSSIAQSASATVTQSTGVVSSQQPRPTTVTSNINVASNQISQSQQASAVSSQQSKPVSNVNVASNQISRPQQLSLRSTQQDTSRGRSLYKEASRHGPQNVPLQLPTKTEANERKEERPPAADEKSTKASESKTTSEESEHLSTLSRFQNFRESLRQRRRQLLGTTLRSGSDQLGVAHFLNREKRVQSLDRTANMRERAPRSHSLVSSDRHRVLAITSPQYSSARSSDSDDSVQGDSPSTTKDQASATSTSQVTSPTTSEALPSPSSDSSPLSPRPVRRAVSAASDKATKMEFLRETWKKRKELLIQNDAYITSPRSSESEDPRQSSEGVGPSVDTTFKTTVKPKPKNGKAEEGWLEPRSSGRSLGASVAASVLITKSQAPTSPVSATANASPEDQVLKTVDNILQKKNVTIPEPRSPNPTSPSHAPLQNPSPPLTAAGSKPSMLVRPRPREPATPIPTTIPTTTTTATTFFPSSLEPLPEDDTKTSPERKTSLRSTSPSRGDPNKGLQNVRASLRRKKERWRSLSLT